MTNEITHEHNRLPEAFSLDLLARSLKNGTIRAIWLDVDQTLLSFDGCAKEAMEYAFSRHGMEWREEYFDVFLRENAKLWDIIESGKMTRNDMRKIRFPVIFKALDLDPDVPETFEPMFTRQLYFGNHPMPGALAGLEKLAEYNLPMYIISNGLKEGQAYRLEKAGMLPYFRDLYTSEEFGLAKPDVRFFQRASELMNQDLGEEIPPEQVLVVGDSWKADIQGAIAFGSPSLFISANRMYDPFEREDHPGVCEIHAWQELLDVLEPASQAEDCVSESRL